MSGLIPTGHLATVCRVPVPESCVCVCVCMVVGAGSHGEAPPLTGMFLWSGEGAGAFVGLTAIKGVPSIPPLFRGGATLPI